MNQQCAKCKTRDLYRGIVPLISSVFFGFREGFFYAVDIRKFRMINGHAGQEAIEDGGTNPIYFWPMFQGYFSGDFFPRMMAGHS
jgi:hypothetical protein